MNIPLVLQIPGSSRLAYAALRVGIRPLSLTKCKLIGLIAHLSNRLFEFLRVYKIGTLKLFEYRRIDS